MIARKETKQMRKSNPVQQIVLASKIKKTESTKGIYDPNLNK